MKVIRTRIQFGFIFIMMFELFSCNLTPGSYPNAETYRLPYSEKKVKEAIMLLKKNNPQTNVPPVTIDDKKRYNLADETEKGSSYWSHFYFYNKEDNEIMLAWTRPSGENKTTFAFVGVNKGLTLGNWKDINSDFTRKENLEKKEKFESLILNNIKRYLK